jgi:hypothetical protein
MTNLSLTEAQLNQLRNGRWYVTVRNTTFANGEIRGQILPDTVDGDFEGDSKADISVYRPSTGMWYFQNSSDGAVRTARFGNESARIIPGDFDGDSKNDVAVFQAADAGNPNSPAICYIFRSSDNVVKSFQWGLSSDIPVVGNFDDNNMNDLAVFRPSNGTWYILRFSDVIKPLVPDFSNTNIEVVKWGTAGDKPLAADFDGNGRDELTVFRPSNGTWYALNTREQTASTFKWGTTGDVPIRGDFDADGKADYTVFRPSTNTWFTFGSLERRAYTTVFGLNGDIPAPADFDKDGAADITVFRPSNGTWHILKSANLSYMTTRFGTTGDIPTIEQK